MIETVFLRTRVRLHDCGICYGIIVNIKAKGSSQIAQLKKVIATNIINGQIRANRAVNQDGLRAGLGCCGFILADDKLRAVGSISLSGGNGNC